jgi:hypothetical protein
MTTLYMQNKVIVMCDLMDFIKLAQNDIYMFYYNPYVNFENPYFDNFNYIEALINENLQMNWFFNT